MGSLVRFRVVARPPSSMPAGMRWRFAAKVDGAAVCWRNIIEGTDQLTYSDMAINLADHAASSAISFVLQLDGPAGLGAQLVELPGVWLDSLVFEGAELPARLAPEVWARGDQQVFTDAAGTVPAVVDVDNIKSWRDVRSPYPIVALHNSASQPGYITATGLNNQPAAQMGSTGKLEVQVDSLVQVSFSFWLVADCTLGGTFRDYWDANGADRTVFSHASSAGDNNCTGFGLSPGPANTGDPQSIIFSADGDANVGRIFRNGALLATGSASKYRLKTGQLNNLQTNGPYAEFGIWWRALDVAEMAALCSYSAVRYGTAN